MYRIIRIADGESLGLTEAPNFIRQSKNGCFVLCPEPEASGIAFEGVPYRLMGRQAPEGMEALETVTLVEADAGQLFKDSEQVNADIDSICVDHEYRLTLLEFGVSGSDQLPGTESEMGGD